MLRGRGGAAVIHMPEEDANHSTGHCTIGQVPELLKKRPRPNGKCYAIAVLGITWKRAGSKIQMRQ
jgi:hypothetical protein